MPIKAEMVAAGCKGSTIITADHLCGSELDLFRNTAVAGQVVVACTDQRTLFEEIAEDQGLSAKLSFANVRETAGWSTDATNAAPKMAALLSAATVSASAPTAVTFNSDGVTLIYGPAVVALEAAAQLKDRLDITVLISDAGAVTTRSARERLSNNSIWVRMNSAESFVSVARTSPSFMMRGPLRSI